MQPSVHRQVGSALEEGWMAGGSFFGSIVSGTLLGYFADRWLGTEPWLVVIGVALGAYSGFMRLWTYSKQAESRQSWRAK
jgi:ATP synthase protein I